MFRRALLERVDGAIARYGLAEPGVVVPVATSGGKDSLFLALALRELGFRPLCLVVDMGYTRGWGARVAGRLAGLGLSADVVDPRSPGARAEPVQVALDRRVGLLDRITVEQVARFTPCTHCYSTKVLSLGARVGEVPGRQVAFGHHRTDAFASFLKAGLMHIDRWEAGHRRFDRRHFVRLADALGDELVLFPVNGPSVLLDHIQRLARQGAIDTDEPPRQPLRRDEPHGPEVIRPLVDVDEQDIATFVTESGLVVEGSGCGHGLSPASETPREAVHRRALGRPLAPATTAFLAGLVALGVDESGRSRRSTRYRRAELLGPDYRPPIGGADKL